jgi:hypothetical protein
LTDLENLLSLSKSRSEIAMIMPTHIQSERNSNGKLIYWSNTVFWQ